MKKIVYIGGAVASLVAGALLLRRYIRKLNLIHFVEEEPNRNFDAFPPDIPGKQFENWLVL